MTDSNDPESHVRFYVRRGLLAMRAGDHTEARRNLYAVLDTDADNITALLWLVWLAPSRRERLTLLSRVMAVAPHDERARSALRWARRRPSNATDPRAEAPSSEAAINSGKTILSAHRLTGPLGLLLVIATCLFLIGVALVARYSPAAVLAWMLPTATPSAPPTPALTPNVVLIPAAATPSPISTPTSGPTKTLTPPSPPSTVATSATVPPASPGGEKWIDVDLTQQILTAYQGDTPVFQAPVSTGLPNTPTVVGQFRIYWKLTATDMTGPGYYLSDVPYTMYFYAGYALHGTYWHSNFGQPMSHGCVNLRTEDAEWLFNWADPTLPDGARHVRSTNSGPGTLVVVHH